MPRVQLRRRQGRRRIAWVPLDLTSAVTSYAEGLYGRRHMAYTLTAAATPRVDTPPPREVYAGEVRRRHWAIRRGLCAVGKCLHSCSVGRLNLQNSLPT
jgi:hypothetical protein